MYLVNALTAIPAGISIGLRVEINPEIPSSVPEITLAFILEGCFGASLSFPSLSIPFSPNFTAKPVSIDAPAVNAIAYFLYLGVNTFINVLAFFPIKPAPIAQAEEIVSIVISVLLKFAFS